eukprot:2015957-Alexandrium_andersonii.AAC.1
MPLEALEIVRSDRISLLRSLRHPRWVRLTPSEVLQTARGQAMLKAVSYTHLTLPTICSV